MSNLLVSGGNNTNNPLSSSNTPWFQKIAAAATADKTPWYKKIAQAAQANQPKVTVGDFVGMLTGLLGGSSSAPPASLLDIGSLLKPYDDASSSVKQQQALALAAQQKIVADATARAAQSQATDQANVQGLKDILNAGAQNNMAANAAAANAARTDLASQGVSSGVLAGLNAQAQTGAANANVLNASNQSYANAMQNGAQQQAALRQDSLNGMGDAALSSTNSNAQQVLSQLAQQRAQAQSQAELQNAQISHQNAVDAANARSNNPLTSILSQVLGQVLSGGGRDTSNQSKALLGLESWGQGSTGSELAAFVKTLSDNGITNASDARNYVDQNWSKISKENPKWGPATKARLYQGIDQYFQNSDAIDPSLLSMLAPFLGRG